ncbi:hypothetical protein MSHOH_3443 [Methanosarcina horonobensis HB-1 = JCM 15518]|uniref:Uncharacterized protein n=2 Tax=Methanosarcina horonobensis TaxID=418008 RepID=A0A0E3SFN3_9EURY|nr:hypothetical protein MSHOH_3443 [Methanosarcina horonobensis HB-1 = JCM 15518]
MRTLLSFVFILFILFISLSAANAHWIKYTEKIVSSAGDLLTDAAERETKLSNGEEYRDGLIDSYNCLINPGYPSGYTQITENTGSGCTLCKITLKISTTE